MTDGFPASFTGWKTGPPPSTATLRTVGAPILRMQTTDTRSPSSASNHHDARGSCGKSGNSPTCVLRDGFTVRQPRGADLELSSFRFDFRTYSPQTSGRRRSQPGSVGLGGP